MKSILLIALSLVTTNLYAKDHEVAQKDKKFTVQKLEIAANDKVVFTNEDPTTHHLMFKWNGKTVSQKQHKKGHAKYKPFEYTFEKSGTTQVRCAIHPKMKLRVTVK